MKERSVKRWTMAGIAVAAAMVWAGSLDSPAPPDDAGSAMYTLEDIYNRLDTGTAGAKRTGPFVEPGAAPGSTGHTLNEVMAKTPAMDNTNGAAPEDVALGKTFWGLKDGTWGLQIGTAMDENTIALLTTGQTTSYATGDDGSTQTGLAWPGPRFTDNGDGTVTDNVTGLVWTQNADLSGTKSWNDALTYCNGLSLAGHDDWRLPNMRELHSLIDYGRADPALPAGHPFTDVQSGPIWGYWTSTTGIDSEEAWGVQLSRGFMNDSYNKVSSYYVWPVRGGGTGVLPKTGQSISYASGDDGHLQVGVTWPNPRFTDNENGTVTDNMTGLVWLKNANAFGARDWATALTYCANLNSGEAGLQDGSSQGEWRLPNVRELHSLIDCRRSGPALPSGYPFTGVQSTYYWSGTTYAYSTDSAWDVNMTSGRLNGMSKTTSTSRYVWPVRGGN